MTLIWQTSMGERKPINDIDHQHLSNILWYYEVFYKETTNNSKTIYLINRELVDRFKGIRLEWKPLPIPGEIERIKKICRIDSLKSIWFDNRKIGTISHIPPFIDEYVNKDINLDDIPNSSIIKK